MEAPRVYLLITKYPLLSKHFNFVIKNAPDQLRYNNPTGDIKEPITADLSDKSFESLTPELAIQLEDLCTDILDITPPLQIPPPTPTLTITQDERTAMKKQLEDLKTEMDRKNAEKYIPLTPEETDKFFTRPYPNDPIPVSKPPYEVGDQVPNPYVATMEVKWVEVSTKPIEWSEPQN